MSIRNEWQKLVADGVLARLSPFIGDPAKRTVLMCPEVEEIINRPMEEGEEANRRVRLLAKLQNIVAGRHLVVCMTPYDARIANMGRLDPIEDCVWDIRCQDEPAVRVFCYFLEKDVLLAVTAWPRSVRMRWLGWLPLGDRYSKQWKRGIRVAKRHWGMYFPAEKPVCGDNLDEYLSNATPE